MGSAHDYLVQRAVRWLKNTKRCPVVVYEFVSSSIETPDALGWSHCGAWSVLVECKTSIADLRADKHKSCRRWGSVGRERYYLTPKEMIAPHLVDHYITGGWGLLEVHGKRIRVIKEAMAKDQQREGMRSEMQMMYSVIRRLGGGKVNHCDLTWVLEPTVSPAEVPDE